MTGRGSPRRPKPHRAAVYQIKVHGRLDPGWSDWFGGLSVGVDDEASDDPITTLTGPVADQAALHGIITRIADLNLVLVSVIRIDAGATSSSEKPG